MGSSSFQISVSVDVFFWGVGVGSELELRSLVSYCDTVWSVWIHFLEEKTRRCNELTFSHKLRSICVIQFSEKVDERGSIDVCS